MLSKRIANITPSATHAMTARIAEKRAAGEDIITFSIGEPDSPTPQPIVDACEQALQEGKTKYTSTNGIAALREAIRGRGAHPHTLLRQLCGDRETGRGCTRSRADQ